MRPPSIRKLTLNILTITATLSFAPMSASTAISSSVVLTLTTPATIYFGQNVDGYAQVNSSDGSPLTGTITFYDNNSAICVISTEANATCPASAGTNFAVGSHVVTAAYSGDAEHSASTSNPAAITVLQDSTTTSISSTSLSAIYGQNVTFTATVQGAHETPAGQVRFLDGTNVLGTETLTSDRTATLSISTLSTGTHAITATYEATPNAASSKSPALTAVIQPQQPVSPTSFAITVAPITVKVGQMASVMVNVAPVTGFNEPVQLSCANLPTESTCTFGSSTIRAGGGSTTLLLSTMAPHDCGSTASYYGSLPYSTPVTAALIVLLFPCRKRRTIKGLLTSIIAFCGMSAMTGCGNCTDLGTKPGTYTIIVAGSAQGTARITVSHNLTLHVVP